MHKIIRCHCDSLVGVSLCISFDARRTILLQIFERTRVAPLNTRCVQPKLIVDEIVETTENGFASSCHYIMRGRILCCWLWGHVHQSHGHSYSTATMKCSNARVDDRGNCRKEYGT